MQDNEPINLTYGQMSDMVNRIEQIPSLSGEGAPTTSTPAFHLGQTYIDTTTGDMYYCSGATSESGSVPEYSWELVTEDAPEYVAGDNITITEESGAYVISADGASYTAGDGINISAQDVISATNTGKARELTTADYNWPTTGTKTSINLALLDSGIYYRSSASVTINNIPPQGAVNNGYGTFVVGQSPNGYTSVIALGDGDLYGNPTWCLVYNQFHALQQSGRVLLDSHIVNNLTTAATNKPLSANQGKVLKDLVDSLVIRASGAPTTSTVGQVGTLYEDTTNGKLYQCTAVSGNTYTWAEVGAGGSGPTVVQAIGTSTTDVMSQNAVTNMICNQSDYPGEVNAIRIGYNAANSSYGGSIAIGMSASAGTAKQQVIALGPSARATDDFAMAIGTTSRAQGNSSIAIGDGASSSGRGAVAIGRSATATAQGQFDIGCNSTSYGYNSSTYRLLTGVYDPQSAHDAATKGYVDTQVGNIATALQALNQGTGA